MRMHDAREVIAALPCGETLFPYRPDGYAPMLLRWRLEAGEPWRDLAHGPLRRLMEKPLLRDLVRRLDGRAPTADDLRALELEGATPFRLSLGLWGCPGCFRWNQTSRPGTNLVLRLDFDRAHDEAFRELVDPFGFRPFEWDRHPVSRDDHTLAWARLDLDWDADEALVEEVQSDWVGEARDAADDPHWFVTDMLERAEREGRPAMGRPRTLHRWRADLETYVTEVLPPRGRRWEEAMLAAALWFAREELGFGRAFMHRWRAGCAFKRLEPGWGPPRSLYEALPGRLAFGRTRERPAMLEGRWAEVRDGLNGREPHFWRIELRS